MTDIVTQVKRVSDLIGEISSSTIEQSAGITQVGQAVSHLDEITQQNAALVEQGAAASESLKQQAEQQAEQLVEAVSVFR
jgi:aerotaxis receptor